MELIALKHASSKEGQGRFADGGYTSAAEFFTAGVQMCASLFEIMNINLYAVSKINMTPSQRVYIIRGVTLKNVGNR